MHFLHAKVNYIYKVQRGVRLPYSNLSQVDVEEMLTAIFLLQNSSDLLSPKCQPSLARASLLAD